MEGQAGTCALAWTLYSGISSWDQTSVAGHFWRIHTGIWYWWTLSASRGYGGSGWEICGPSTKWRSSASKETGTRTHPKACKTPWKRAELVPKISASFTNIYIKISACCKLTIGGHNLETPWPQPNCSTTTVLQRRGHLKQSLLRQCWCIKLFFVPKSCWISLVIWKHLQTQPKRPKSVGWFFPSTRCCCLLQRVKTHQIGSWILVHGWLAGGLWQKCWIQSNINQT